MTEAEWGRFIGTAIVVGIIGPLFWLGVNVLEGKIRRLINERKAKKPAAPDSRFLK